MKDKFKKDFIKIIRSYRGFRSDDNGLSMSYTDIAVTNRDPIRDLDIFESDLYDLGWDDETLYKLFSEFGDNITGDLCDESRGVGDVFLWKWTKNVGGDIFPLSGVGINEFSKPEKHEEILIKYSYGWHRHKYGQLYIQEMFTKEGFMYMVPESFWYLIIEPTIVYHKSLIVGSSNFRSNQKTKMPDEVFKDIMTRVEFGHGYLSIKLVEVVDIMNNLLNEISKKSGENIENINYTQAKRNLKRISGNYTDKFSESDNSIIISFDF